MGSKYDVRIRPPPPLPHVIFGQILSYPHPPPLSRRHLCMPPKGSPTQKECQQWTPISPSISAKMASVMMELTEEARAHMFGPWNPYFHVTKVLIDTMDRVSIPGLD